jgi:hypothetical protein
MSYRDTFNEILQRYRQLLERQEAQHADLTAELATLLESGAKADRAARECQEAIVKASGVLAQLANSKNHTRVMVQNINEAMTNILQALRDNNEADDDGEEWKQA